MASDVIRDILVMGATGKVGGCVARELAAAPGLHVRAAGRSPKRVARLIAEGIDVVTLDLDRPATCTAALVGIDAMLLLTGYHVDMLTHGKRMIDAAKQAGVRHIVHIGAWARADTGLAPALWHQLLEAYIERSGIGFTNLQPNYFMQNLVAMAGASIKAEQGAVYHYVGDARISWIDANDIGRVAAAVLRSPERHSGKTYPLAAGAHSMADIVALMSDQFGRPYHYVARPPVEFLDKMLRIGMDPTYAGALADSLAATAAGEVPEAGDTFDTVQEVTGRPAVTLAGFLERHRTELTY